MRIGKLLAYLFLATAGFQSMLTSARAEAQTPNSIPDDVIFYDSDGLIIHREGGRPDGAEDGGDTAQREGWYWLGVWIRQNTPGMQPWTTPRSLNFDQVLALLEPNQDGVFYRHPKQPKFNNPWDKEYGTSRDQLIPLIAAMGVWGKHDALRRLWAALPEDLTGKHAFNGNWRNFLGQAGQDCTAIKKRGCDATTECSLKVDDRDCSLKVDTRDCSLKSDSRDCSLQVDDRSCGHDVCAFGACVHVNDPICEAAKAGQNAIYAAAKAKCEGDKAAQNVIYKGEHDACEAAKGAQNAAYAAEKATCETGKASQNALYKAEHDACEVEKAASKAACEGQKTLDQLACGLTNVFSGDLIGPSAINLLRRSLGEDPMNPLPSIYVPPIDMLGLGPAGEVELVVNSRLRVSKGEDRDEVDDLNHIVALVMSKLRYPSPVSDGAISLYMSYRPHSYGSYLVSYRSTYGNDDSDMGNRIRNGIASGWQPDTSAAMGTIRWYHRRVSGANPALADLYEPIVGFYLH
ncbi:MAG TPA: hypothetical protein VJ725_29485 [Thermoanaerobaculia bacterium]|nr:hypothetical protein [Thermoanaerobaculia bacterium]